MTPHGRFRGIVIAGQVGRKAARSAAVWGAVFAGYVAAQAMGYASAYRTQAARDQLASAFGGKIGITARIGPARSINTVVGYCSWRAVGVLSLLGGIWGLLTATRLVRGEEEAGRAELLLAGQTTRRRAGLQSLLVLAAGLLTLFLITALGTVATGNARSVGFSVGASLYLALTVVCGAATFLALGALASQLVNTRRRAASLGAVVFAVAYGLRMVADSDPSLHWLVWLSPLGWIEESQPLTDPNPAALLPVLAVVAVACALTVHLSGTRDTGAATLPDRDSGRPRLALLRGPVGLATRMMRPVAIGWLFAVAAYSVLIGSVAQSAAKSLTSSNTLVRALERLGGHGSLVEAYLGLTMLLLAMMIAFMSAGQAADIRGEEADGRMEALIVRPVGRLSWFAGRLALSTTLLTVAGAVAGIGAWLGAASQHSGVRFGSLLEAGINIVPPAVFLLGLAAITLGLAPRYTAAVAYGYLAWSFLIEFIGAVVHANHWILDTSVFFHMAPAPATSPHWVVAALVAGLGVAGMLAGAICLHRRDLAGA